MASEENIIRDVDVLRFLGFLETPPLWLNTGHFPFPQYEIGKTEVQMELPELPSPPKMVLGKRIELFFQYFIDHFSEEKVLAANTQIISQKVTVGELDFLLFNEQKKKATHVEVVYKFYLYDPGFGEELQRWIGPNRRDSLLKKLTRLKTHQFPLLYKPETGEFLQNLNLSPEEIEQKILFKAQLFVPKEQETQTFPFINNECICGYWIPSSKFVEAEYGNYKFFSPKKPDWPIDPKDCREWYSFSEIKKQLCPLLENRRAPLVWMKKNEQEFSRIFVVWW